MRLLFPLITFSLLLMSCGQSTLTITGPDGKVVIVKVEIADTPKEREVGLMQRAELADDSGMLFVFKNSDMLRFWMKNTLIPLDILFFDVQGKMTSAIDHMDPCTKDPCRIYPSIEPSRYALEVPAGFRLKHSIGVGWSIDPQMVVKMANPQ